jgi:TolA-binding protein
MIQGLQGSLDIKIATMNDVLNTFPNSDYADDASFEIAYTYFLKNDGDKAKTDLNAMIQKYPHSSYVPRALVTIGLIDYNANHDDLAIESFKKVVADYSSTDEAKKYIPIKATPKRLSITRVQHLLVTIPPRNRKI